MRITFVVITASIMAVAAFVVFHRARTSTAQELRAAEEARAQKQELAQVAQAPALPPATVAPGALAPAVVELAPPTPAGPGGANRFRAVEVTPYPPGVTGGWGAGDPETGELTGQDQQLEQEVQSLVHQLAESTDDRQRAELKDKLAGTLEKQFDTQQKLRELEVSRIEARVQKLRDVVKKRTDSRRKIIDNRLEQLLNDADGLGWNAATGQGIHFVPQGMPGMMGLPRGPGMMPGVAPVAPTPKR